MLKGSSCSGMCGMLEKFMFSGGGVTGAWGLTGMVEVMLRLW